MSYVSELIGQEYLDSIVEEVYGSLSEEDRDYIREHPDPAVYHFSLGLDIRNNYIYQNPKMPDIAKSGMVADNVSGWVIEQIIDRLKKEAEQ